MKKLDAWLARADDGLRTLLLGRGLPGWLLGICTFAAFFPLIAVALIYLVIVVALSAGVTKLERRLRNGAR